MSDKKTVTITIDGKKIAAPVDQPILQTALEHGIKIPYFCYHPYLRPDGNCRMCLVEIEKIKKPVISCMTYPAEGMVVYTQTEKVKALRKAILEFVLVNHPLDCPICDKVGECELQANYFGYSGAKSHFPDPTRKVRALKLEHLSDRILFDSERCIKCGRCVRFTREISKSYWLGLVNRGVHTTMAIGNEECKDPYSDCVADICPVGALTKSHFRFKSRVYMLRRTESVCPLCSRGCNIYLEHKRNVLYRVMPRCNPEINKCWMCNAGRDLYRYLNRERCKTALYKNGEIGYEEAIEKLISMLEESRACKSRKLAIASTFGSDEEIEGFMEFCVETLNAEVYYKTDSILGRDECPGDEFLITNDKNPNRYTLVHSWGLKEISDSVNLDQVDLLLVWGEGLGNSLPRNKMEELLSKARTKVLLTPFKEEMMERYDLVLPLRTFSEKSGTFTNVEGKKSRFEMAFSVVECKEEGALWQALSALADKFACCS